MPTNAGNLLDDDHAIRRNSLPLGNRLRCDFDAAISERCGQLRRPARSSNRPVANLFHTTMKAFLSPNCKCVFR